MTTRSRPLARVLLLALLQAGCQNPRHLPTADPVADFHNAELPLPSRVGAATRAWERSAAEPEERASTRAAFKSLAWQSATPLDLRTRIMDLLINDSDQAGAQDARTMVRLMLAREPSRAMMAYLCETVAARRWTECAPNLVRSYARIVPAVPDQERAEAIALRSLFPDRDAESIVFEVFLNPPDDDQKATPAGALAIDWTERARADAWDLLGRLDTEGTRRAALITGSGDELDSNPAVALLRRCRADLRCVPLSGDELRWLRSLADPSKADNRAWWEQSRSAVAALAPEQSERLALRHIEPVRWAASHLSQWLTATRQDLLDELARRLDSRHHRQRSADKTDFRQPSPQTLAHWRTHLRWGDVLAALVIDEAVRQPLVLTALVQQAEIDRRDPTTEYGGLLEWAESPVSFRARLFPPRPGQREGDYRFVASDDLIGASDRALAQYHFHAQHLRNDSFAGPSHPDLQYAARSGRNCIVVTSVSEGTFNIDYYQPDGVVLDLGDVKAANR